MVTVKLQTRLIFIYITEGELETEWLKDAGLSHLTEPFMHGREVSESELEGALLDFSKLQAEAIKRRVKTLNNTIRQRRSKAKHRKADVRDVFKDYEVSDVGKVVYEGQT